MDFEVEADSDLGQVPLSLNCDLEISPLKVATSLEKRHRDDLAAITNEVSGLVDLTAYGELQKVPGGVAFPISS